MTEKLKQDIAALARALHTHIHFSGSRALHREAFDRVGDLAFEWEAQSSQKDIEPDIASTSAGDNGLANKGKQGGFDADIRADILATASVYSNGPLRSELIDAHIEAIANEVRATHLPTPQDFAKEGLQSGDVVYFSGLGYSRTVSGMLPISEKEWDAMSCIKRNGQVVAARHFQEDR